MKPQPLFYCSYCLDGFYKQSDMAFINWTDANHDVCKECKKRRRKHRPVHVLKDGEWTVVQPPHKL